MTPLLLGYSIIHDLLIMIAVFNSDSHIFVLPKYADSEESTLNCKFPVHLLSCSPGTSCEMFHRSSFLEGR